MDNEPAPALPTLLASRLRESGIDQTDEVALRETLESRAPTYTLYRLAPAAARKWNARYRITLGPSYFDAQSVPEAYALGILYLFDCLNTPSTSPAGNSLLSG